MGPRDVVTSLTDNWAATVPYLRPDDLRRIAQLAMTMSAAAEDDRSARTAANELAELLLLRLPAGHPVTAAIASEPRLVAGPADWPRIAGVLQALPGVADLIPAADEVIGRLRSVAAVTADQVIAAGDDPYRDDLVRLPAQIPGEPVRLPAFQFGLDGHPIRLVAQINRLLDAADDPWGVADWWLSRNAWLNAVPADLIGSGQDEALTEAARAELGEA
jgi:hypothetical protein